MKNKKWIGIIAGVLILAAVLAAVFVTGGSKNTENFAIGGSKEEQSVGQASATAVPTDTPSEEASEQPDATGKAEDNSAAKTEEPKKVKPTFMYFVSEADADYEDAVKTFEALKKEYGDRVVFDFKNVTKEPELLDNFSFIAGQTPALIMLNTSNDINNFVFACHDQEKLKAEIEAAFTK